MDNFAFWKNSSSAQPPAPVVTDKEDGGPRSQLPKDFESSATSLLQGQLAEIWLTGSHAGSEKPDPAAQLLALAAQACSEIAHTDGTQTVPGKSMFTERLKAPQVLFTHFSPLLGQMLQRKNSSPLVTKVDWCTCRATSFVLRQI